MQAWPRDYKLNVNKHLEQIQNSLQVILSRISKTLASVVPRLDSAIHLAPVVQKLDSTIQQINHYPVDKYQGNKLHYSVDRHLFGGQRYPHFEPVNQGQLNLYPVDSAIFISFLHTHPMDSDLSGGQRYLTFEQLEPDEKHKKLR